jgi:Flp pilus assembly protein TadG
LFNQVNRLFGSRTTRKSPACRRAAATVELAVCLPILVTVVFGSIQACNLIYLKQAVTTAAYEGTLELAKASATTASVRSRIEQILAARDVENATIQLIPTGQEIANLTPGNQVSIRVSAPTASNLILNGFFPVLNSVSADIVATR